MSTTKSLQKQQADKVRKTLELTGKKEQNKCCKHTATETEPYKKGKNAQSLGETNRTKNTNTGPTPSPISAPITAPEAQTNNKKRKRDAQQEDKGVEAKIKNPKTKHQDKNNSSAKGWKHPTKNRTNKTKNETSRNINHMRRI